MNISQFESKCCNARVFLDFTCKKDESEGTKWRCSNANII
jgi:hypothetical protein